MSKKLDDSFVIFICFFPTLVCKQRSWLPDLQAINLDTILPLTLSHLTFFFFRADDEIDPLDTFHTFRVWTQLDPLDQEQAWQTYRQTDTVPAAVTTPGKYTPQRFNHSLMNSLFPISNFIIYQQLYRRLFADILFDPHHILLPTVHFTFSKSQKSTRSTLLNSITFVDSRFLYAKIEENSVGSIVFFPCTVQQHLQLAATHEKKVSLSHVIFWNWVGYQTASGGQRSALRSVRPSVQNGCLLLRNRRILIIIIMMISSRVAQGSDLLRVDQKKRDDTVRRRRKKSWTDIGSVDSWREFMTGNRPVYVRVRTCV